MAKHVGAGQPAEWNARTHEPALNDPGNRRGVTEGSGWITSREEQAPTRAGWSVVLDVIGQRLAHLMRQWQDSLSTGLPSCDTQQSRPPVYVVNVQRYDLGSPEPEARQQKENRSVAASGGTCRLGSVQKPRELLRRKMWWEARMPW